MVDYVEIVYGVNEVIVPIIVAVLIVINKIAVDKIFVNAVK